MVPLGFVTGLEQSTARLRIMADQVATDATPKTYVPTALCKPYNEGMGPATAATTSAIYQLNPNARMKILATAPMQRTIYSAKSRST